MVIAVLVRDENCVYFVEAQTGASIEFGCHRLFVFKGWVNNDVETIAGNHCARADCGSNAAIVAFTPVTIAREIADGDDIPTFDR